MKKTTEVQKRPETARERALGCFKPRDDGKKKAATFRFRQIQEGLEGRSRTAPPGPPKDRSKTPRRAVAAPPVASKAPSWMAPLLQKCEDEYDVSQSRRSMRERRQKNMARRERDADRSAVGWGLGGKVECYTRRYDPKTGTIVRKKSSAAQEEGKDKGKDKKGGFSNNKVVPALNLKPIKK